MAQCPHPIGYFVNKYGVTFPVKCGSWQCPVCSRLKKTALMLRISEGFRHSPVCYMLTLTELKTPDGNDTEISKHFARLRSSLAKHGVYMKRSFWVKELAPLYAERNDDNPRLYRHMHVMTDTVLDAALVSRLWYLATDKTAYRVDVTASRVKNPAGYLTKYLTKFQKGGFEKHERRFQFSRDSGFSLEREGIYLEYKFVFDPGHPLAYHNGKISAEDLKYKFKFKDDGLDIPFLFDCFIEMFSD